MNYEEKIKKSEQEIETATNSKIKMVFTVKTVDDEKVCNECHKFEGYSDDIKNARVGVNYPPPFHEKCRCFARNEIEGIRK